jgi:cytochrome c oxidase subunit 2
LGASNINYVSAENPFGLDKNDPNDQENILIESADLHLPVGKPIKVQLRSLDVLHNFYVPEFRANMDLVPGMVTYFWLTPTRTGRFDVLCLELCGTGHYTMRGAVVVEGEAAYDAWLRKQSTFRQSLAEAKDAIPSGHALPRASDKSSS